MAFDFGFLACDELRIVKRKHGRNFEATILESCVFEHMYIESMMFTKSIVFFIFRFARGFYTLFKRVALAVWLLAFHVVLFLYSRRV